jgi:hypothetical protein
MDKALHETREALIFACNWKETRLHQLKHDGPDSLMDELAQIQQDHPDCPVASSLPERVRHALARNKRKPHAGRNISISSLYSPFCLNSTRSSGFFDICLPAPAPFGVKKA